VIKGYIKPFDKDGFLVGAEDKETDYSGPAARVTADGSWLHIVTDDYEGNAMLNIEALPYLRRALAKLEKARKTAARDTKKEG
jgi:hypothetical protein